VQSLRLVKERLDRLAELLPRREHAKSVAHAKCALIHYPPVGSDLAVFESGQQPIALNEPHDVCRLTHVRQRHANTAVVARLVPLKFGRTSDDVVAVPLSAPAKPPRPYRRHECTRHPNAFLAATPSNGNGIIALPPLFATLYYGPQQTGRDGMTHTVDRLMLRVAEVGDAIGCSRSKAYELIASGEIPSVKVGGCRRVPVDALRRWIDESLQQVQSEGGRR
jgi:excisionase family DNA binding protein